VAGVIGLETAELMYTGTAALMYSETAALLRPDEQDFKRACPRTWYYGKEIKSAEKAAGEAGTPEPAGADLGHDENRYASLTQRETSQLAAKRY